MSIITLTTDFGLKDHFVGALKGKILSKAIDVQIIDISHNIDLFNISEAGYVIKSAYKNFPNGTIHLIGVDCELAASGKHLAVEWDNHYFICADNGILSILCGNEVPTKIIEIDLVKQSEVYTSDIDILLSSCCQIAKGQKLDSLGNEIYQLKPVSELQATVENGGNSIKGNIIYIDHFGNCVTNISREMFNTIKNERPFEIGFGSKTIKKIHRSYSDFNVREGYTLKDYEGEKLALFNEAGYLEIAIYRSNPNTTGTASSLLGLKYRDVITINFRS